MGEDKIQGKLFLIGGDEYWEIGNISEIPTFTIDPEGEEIKPFIPQDFEVTCTIPKLKKWQKQMLFGWRSTIPTRNTRSRQILKVLSRKHGNPYDAFIMTMTRIGDALDAIPWKEV